MDADSAAQNGLSNVRISPAMSTALMSFKGSFGTLNSGSQQILGGMNQIITMNDDQKRILSIMSASVNTIFAGLILYEAISRIRKIDVGKETIAAAIETAAMAAAQQWQNIALATGAAIGIAASFGAGYYVGERHNRRSASINANADINNPAGRRAAISAVVGVNG